MGERCSPYYREQLREVLPQRIPVTLVPTRPEMLCVPFWKSGVVEDQPGTAVVVLQFEPDDRIRPLIPVGDAPRLHMPLVRNEFDVSARDRAAMTGKGTTGFATDLGGAVRGKIGVLLRVHQRFVDAFRTGCKIDL